MKIKEFKSGEKRLVIGGYVLLVLIMLMGLFAIYRNLVNFSDKRIKTEDRQELLIVSNIINQLYEAEGSNDLLTFESASKYIESFDSIRPIINLRIDTLKLLTSDSLRISQLDTLEVLLERKLENLEDVVELMDSLRKSPSIITQTNSTYAPRKSNVSKYIKDETKDNAASDADTTVIKREKRGLFKRLGDAITGRQDSTVIVETRQSAVVQKDYELVVDTIVNMVRHSERLNLENQRKFQVELASRQATMNATNRILTVRVDELLKQIEREEREKVLALVEVREHILSKSYNTVFWVSIIAVTIAVVFGLLFVVDINRSHRYKRELEESNRKINKLLQSREKLMLSISHDIKAPMSSVLGYIELIESNLNKGSHDTYLSNMKQSSEHVLQLVSNLLDFQRLESDTWRKNEMNISIKELVDNTVDSFAPLASKKSLTYNVVNNIPKDLSVNGDPFMIREIYSNVISNAIKYTVKGKVTVNVSFKNGTLHLSVKDTGVGILEEDRHLVFEEFERINVEHIDNYSEGTGLGMAITKGLVEQLGGHISFESEKGVGTEFVVDIPLEIYEGQANSGEEIVIETTNRLFEDKHILIVDDDSIQQLMVSEMLKTKGVKSVSETNPNKVIDILRRQSFDLIFLDIQMPEMNGFTLIKKIIDSGVLKDKMTAIIAVTATSEINLQEYKDSGFAGFLNKPFTSNEMFAAIADNVYNRDVDQKNNPESSNGVEALISYVKDDKDSSLAILKAFSDESKLLNEHLRGIGKDYDAKITSNMAHKMLPLFKMIGDDYLSNILYSLEKKESVSKGELIKVIDKVEFYIDEASSLISRIEKV